MTDSRWKNAPSDERTYWVMLSMVAGIGPVRFRRLLEVCGDARRGWVASDAELAMAGFERRSAESLRQLRSSLTPEAAFQRLARLGVRTVTMLEDDYPSALREIADPPPVLFVRGRITDADTQAVALVGTRRATTYGRTIAERFSRDLAMAGITIVSGLAKGIDTVAHRSALDAGGRTIAVLGNGLDQVYPPENAQLVRRIVENNVGAIVSEFPPGVPPDAANFPRRNRIISGLCAATVIVEAGHRSGALITADFALEQGRDVFAVPGSILSPMSDGPNGLIKQGATPATDVRDILEVLGVAVDGSAGQARTVQALGEQEIAVMQALSAEPRHVDELARLIGKSTGEVVATLTLLELKGLARHAGSMTYTRL
jgi:DNA processing protein